MSKGTNRSPRRFLRMRKQVVEALDTATFENGHDMRRMTTEAIIMDLRTYNASFEAASERTLRPHVVYWLAQRIIGEQTV